MGALFNTLFFSVFIPFPLFSYLFYVSFFYSHSFITFDCINLFESLPPDLSIDLSIFLRIYLSLALSLSLYIHVRMYECVRVCTYVCL